MDRFPFQESVYSRFRCEALLNDFTLRDGQHKTRPPEILLQRIWHHQRLKRSELRSTQGRRLTILHPGFWNRGSGPDFKDALLQFDQDPPVSGDVEIDLAASGWFQHGHHDNVQYRNVKLHAVWTPPTDAHQAGRPPTLVIEPWLDSPLDELRLWLLEAPEYPACALGKCNAPLQSLDEGRIEMILRQAAQVRLDCKAQAFLARAQSAGWEQSLWEGLFAGLGYKQNIWPMRRLAELLPLWKPGISCTSGIDSKTAQAILLGLAGLLPSTPESLRDEAASWTRELWHLWWRKRDGFAEVILPPTAWRGQGIRPANHPQRRLALAAAWIANPQFLPSIESWIHTRVDSAQSLKTLSAAFEWEPDPFWTRHWSLESAPFDRPQRLLGRDRILDLAMNAILPWALIRARLGGNEALVQQISNRYFELPAAGDNAPLKQAELRLFSGRSPVAIKRAALQQGLLQIVRDFCLASDAICTNCRFPELVKELGNP